MQPDPELLAEVRSWLVKAGRDLAAARFEMGAAPPLLDDIAFHAQQAVEKSLKGFLTFHGHRFRKTHSLIELGEACVAFDRSLEALLRRAAPLTEYAWKFRYPGEPEEPSLEETTEALVIAEEVYDAVATSLPREARP